MKRILIVLIMIAGSVFIANPALAAEGDAATGATTEAQAPADPALAEEKTPPADSAAEVATVKQKVVEAPAPVTPVTEDATPAAKVTKAASSARALIAEGPVPVTQVTLCHVPPGNPANIHKITPSINSVVGDQGHIHDDLDIIPPFYYENGDGDVVLFPGLNWDAAGQAQFANPDCEAVVVVNPTSVPTEDPSAKAPTCLADGALVVPTTDHVVYTVSPVGQTGPGTYTVNAEPADADYVLTGETEWTIPVLPKLTGQELCPVIVVDEDPNDVSKITICHAPLGNIGNIHLITVSVNSIVKGAGHDGHSDDIIPSFSYTDDNDQSATYPGKNYDTLGQYLLDPANAELDCQTPLIDQDAVPSVTETPTCAGHTSVVPNPVTGVDYVFTFGDGLTGPWEITASALDSFVLNGEFVFSGDAGVPADCPPGDDGDLSDVEDAVDDSGTPDGVDPVDAALPDTGGLSLGLLPFSALLIVGGSLLVARRRRV